MAADLGLVAHAAQRLPHELAPRGLGDRLAERGLTDAGRADEAQDRPLQFVGPRLDAEVFDDPVLDLLERIMVLVEHRLRRLDILLELGFLAPRQAQQHVEIVAHDGRLGGHRRHRLQLLELGRRLAPRFLGKLELGDLLGQLGDLVALAFLALVAEFALDRLQLLIEIIFALRLLHLAFDATLDLLLDLQHAELAFHEGERHFQPLGRIALDKQRLLVGNLDRDVPRDRIGEPRGVVDLGKLHRGFSRQLAVQLGIILELLDHRAHQRLDLAIGAIELALILDRLDRAGQVIAGFLEHLKASALFAFDEHAHRAVRQLEELQDRRADADVIQVIAAGIVLRRIELRDQEDFLVGGHRRFQRGDGLVAANEQRHDHIGKDDDVAQGKNGKTLGHEHSDTSGFGRALPLIWWRRPRHQSVARNRMTMKTILPHLLVAGGLLSIAAGVDAQTAKLPAKGEPPLTAQTQRSGGPIDPDQAKLQFDVADLRFEVIPKTETLNGIATLSFTAKAPLTRLVVDLDHNLGPQAVAIDGKPLPQDAWANPDGRLVITLPAPVAAGGHVSTTITYGGQPHVAIQAPWDDGMVWAKTPAGKTWFATTSEGYGCDIFWPCLDFPTGEPGRVDLHITVPKGLKAPSNGVLKGVDTLPDGRTTWNWSIAHPNTYAIALNVAPYEVVEGSYHSQYGNNIPMFYWYLPGEEEQATALSAEFAPTLDFYETMIGPYPFGNEKMGVVETPHEGM